MCRWCDCAVDGMTCGAAAMAAEASPNYFSILRRSDHKTAAPAPDQPTRSPRPKERLEGSRDRQLSI